MESHKNKRHIFHVQGMHCQACSILIADKIGSAEQVVSVKVDSERQIAEVVTTSPEPGGVLAVRFTDLLSPHGYSMSLERKAFLPRWPEFKLALPLAAILAGGFILLQKAGLVGLIGSSAVTLPTAFGIGIVASLSSCLAVVGGLLLSVSANYAKDDRSGRGPMLAFHAGRLASFFVLGGVIGWIGRAFTLNLEVSVVLGALVGLVMLVLGLNLLDVFPWAKKLQPRLPRFLVRTAGRTSRLRGSAAPFLIGLSTFFLPCGFTQSMQIYSLTTGSFTAGALTMSAFALGTLPVLALISFSSWELSRGRWAGVFFKTAGLLVIAFGALNILNGLVVAGWLPPIVNF